MDKDGNPLRNDDISRYLAAELHYIVDTIGFDRFVEIVGGQPSVAFLPNKLLWFKKNEPDLFAKLLAFYRQVLSLITN